MQCVQLTATKNGRWSHVGKTHMFPRVAVSFETYDSKVVSGVVAFLCVTEFLTLDVLVRRRYLAQAIVS